ncbi:MAG: MarR family transcriptional regulator, partial [Thermofilaceae archaeon]
LYVASVIAGAGDVSLTLETTGERVRVPVLPNPFAGVTEKQLQVLRNLPSTVTALSSKMGVSKAAVSRLLQRLREKGLAVERAGRYEVSPAGRLLLGALG